MQTSENSSLPRTPWIGPKPWIKSRPWPDELSTSQGYATPRHSNRVSHRRYPKRKEEVVEMLKSTAKKAMRVGRASTSVVGLAVILALTVGVASTAVAGSGVGATFNLGKVNTVNAVSKLVGSVAGPSLTIDNSSTNATATALDLQVEAGKAPMKVNSEAQVINLNADKLDGKTASEFMASSVYTRSVSTSGQPRADGTRVAQASCDPEDRVLTGGFVGLDEGTRLINSFPGTVVPVWQVDWENDATADTISIVVHCIDQF